jgi:hypothetical protein
MLRKQQTTMPIPTPYEFAKIVSCERCTVETSPRLLRDTLENVPQPGFIGANYKKKRIVLAGQNPGLCPTRFANHDAVYTAALRAVRDNPNAETMTELNRVLINFVPEWPVHGNYFPLEECGLDLNDIAYFNVVRCRTQNNSAPGQYVINNCLQHFEHWVDVLKPQVVIFIGKWAFDRAGHITKQLGIPSEFMNRQRNLNAAERLNNRNRVVDLVRNIIG